MFRKNLIRGCLDLLFDCKNCAVFVYICLYSLASANSVSITITEEWGNLEAGTNEEFHVVIKSANETHGNLEFSVVAGSQPIIRREIEVTVAADRPTIVPVKFTVPPLKDNVAIQSMLTVAFHAQGNGMDKTVASVEKSLWFFAANPFANREKSLKDKKITLFDPDGKTQKRFEQAGIPFDLAPRLDAIATVNEGILVIGEGLSLRDFKSLAEMCLAAAVRGASVLCLALKDGQFLLIDSNDGALPSPHAMSFRHNDIIANLDKRLDANAWPPDGILAARTLMISGDRGPVSVEVVDKTDGWPWIELTFNSHGKVIFCQYDIIEKWVAGPAPRYLLAALLDHLLANNLPKGGTAAAAGPAEKTQKEKKP